MTPSALTLTPVVSVSYITDDGTEAFAIVVKRHGDTFDLAWLDPDTYQWHAANAVPAERVK